MKLDCSVLGVAIKSNAKPGKPSKGIVTIGKSKLKASNGPQTYQLQVSTAKMRNQPAIQLSAQNIQSFITTYSAAGKVTLDFGSPAIRLFISNAAPNRLALFCRHIQKIREGKEIENIDSVKEVKSTEIQTQTRLTCDGNRHYWTDYAKQFPSSLVLLSVANCNLSRLDVRWFTNISLSTMNLANNSLGKNDKEIRKFRLLRRLVNLKSLDLSGNGLEMWPAEAAFPPSLLELNLSSNRLRAVPASVQHAKALLSLNLSDNPALEALPRRACWPRLKVLQINDTSIHTLPYYLSRMQLDKFRCANRPHPPDELLIQANAFSHDVSSLESLAANAVRKYHLPEDILPWTIQMDSLSWQCDGCFKWLPPSRILRSLFLKNAIALAGDVDTMSDILFRNYICQECARRACVR